MPAYLSEASCLSDPVRLFFFTTCTNASALLYTEYHVAGILENLLAVIWFMGRNLVDFTEDGFFLMSFHITQQWN